MRPRRENRVKPVAGSGGRLWEVIGTARKTPHGPKFSTRRYLIRHPLAEPPPKWPELDDERLDVIWNGYLCEFGQRGRRQYELLKLLTKRRGRWVNQATIEDEVFGEQFTKPATIRQLKRRLVKTLVGAGMSKLAAAIVPSRKGEGMKLDLGHIAPRRSTEGKGRT